MSARDEYAASLRAFADWVENEAVEADLMSALQSQKFLLALSENPAVVEFAAKHKADVKFDDEGNASCDLTFGSITCHAYGYVDFDQHIRDAEEKYARRWANENGMEIVHACEDGAR